MLDRCRESFSIGTVPTVMKTVLEFFGLGSFWIEFVPCTFSEGAWVVDATGGQRRCTMA